MSKKVIVYVQRHIAVELDLDEVKQLYGSTKKAKLEEAAWEAAWEQAPYMTTYEVGERYDDAPPVKKVRRGIGSY